MLETTMQFKTGILAAAAALALAIPTAAMAQPYGYDRQDDFRRIERQRDFRRAEAFRRLRWEREHHRGYDVRGWDDHR
jgi:hypothetical protein